MLTLDEIRKRKKECHYTNEELSVLSGIPLGTLQKVLGNVTRSPRYETMKALSAVFEDSSAKESSCSYTDKPLSHGILMDGAPAYQARHPVSMNTHHYNRQGTYTIEDYLALPDEQRVELIDGVIYDMGAPTIPHQLIAGFIYAQLLDYILKHKGPCMPFIAPTDVQLDCDGRTMVQPDVLIVCDRNKINRKRVFGAPDFTIEVLSPSTRNKDILIKSGKYQRAGVREFWLIDPDAETILVFDFEQNVSMKLYTFNDKVPVGIYDGDCVVDFPLIRESCSFLNEREE